MYNSKTTQTKQGIKKMSNKTRFITELAKVIELSPGFRLDSFAEKHAQEKAETLTEKFLSEIGSFSLAKEKLPPEMMTTCYIIGIPKKPDSLYRFLTAE